MSVFQSHNQKRERLFKQNKVHTYGCQLIHACCSWVGDRGGGVLNPGKKIQIPQIVNFKFIFYFHEISKMFLWRVPGTDAILFHVEGGGGGLQNDKCCVYVSGHPIYVTFNNKINLRDWLEIRGGANCENWHIAIL